MWPFGKKQTTPTEHTTEKSSDSSPFTTAHSEPGPVNTVQDLRSIRTEIQKLLRQHKDIVEIRDLSLMSEIIVYKDLIKYDELVDIRNRIQETDGFAIPTIIADHDDVVSKVRKSRGMKSYYSKKTLGEENEEPVDQPQSRRAELREKVQGLEVEKTKVEFEKLQMENQLIQKDHDSQLEKERMRRELEKQEQEKQQLIAKLKAEKLKQEKKKEKQERKEAEKRERNERKKAEWEAKRKKQEIINRRLLRPRYTIVKAVKNYIDAVAEVDATREAEDRELFNETVLNQITPIIDQKRIDSIKGAESFADAEDKFLQSIKAWAETNSLLYVAKLHTPNNLDNNTHYMNRLKYLEDIVCNVGHENNRDPEIPIDLMIGERVAFPPFQEYEAEMDFDSEGSDSEEEHEIQYIG